MPLPTNKPINVSEAYDFRLSVRECVFPSVHECVRSCIAKKLLARNLTNQGTGFYESVIDDVIDGTHMNCLDFVGLAVCQFLSTG